MIKNHLIFDVPRPLEPHRVFGKSQHYLYLTNARFSTVKLTYSSSPSPGVSLNLARAGRAVVSGSKRMLKSNFVPLLVIASICSKDRESLTERMPISFKIEDLNILLTAINWAS